MSAVGHGMVMVMVVVTSMRCSHLGDILPDDITQQDTKEEAVYQYLRRNQERGLELNISYYYIHIFPVRMPYRRKCYS